MAEFDYSTIDDLNSGTQKRETLASIPCGFKDHGARREWEDLDIFRVTDDARGTDYTYLCVNDTEIRITAKSATILATILE